MKDILEQTLLYDFYGELLNEHQKEIYEQYLLEDLSLGEIAREAGISRQGVHEVIKRCSNILTGYEEKLHLVDKFMFVRGKVQQIEETLKESETLEQEELIQRIHSISQEIVEEL